MEDPFEKARRWGLGLALTNDIDTDTDTAKSPIEEQFWAAHLQLQLPMLVHLQRQVEVAGYFIDFGFPESKIGIELNGYAWHSDKETFLRDRQRGRHLLRRGWVLIHFAGKEVYDDPEACVQEAADIVTAIVRHRATRRAGDGTNNPEMGTTDPPPPSPLPG